MQPSSLSRKVLYMARGFIQGHGVGDDKPWVDIARLNFFEQHGDVPLDVGLAGLHREPFVHEGAEGHLVQHADVDAGDREGPAFAAAHDGFAEDVRPVCSRASPPACPIDNGVGCSGAMRFGSHRVDATVGAMAGGHLHETLLHMSLWCCR